MSSGLRPFIALFDSVGHIGAAVRAAEEFERARNVSKDGTPDARSAAASIPL
ncbi:MULTISPECIES: hypothetical protein [Rhizobium]|uniref:Uncharacterized protein n=1 Tax=Rhizobium tropici TaxID=398 RepID=A0ABR6QY29_RHITR|nr:MULTISPECIES: hypothetical protein [Rhizobium]AGB70511.1 hypothetical protein RTCIAT899_CH05515 [Rhizobium tropici CIAT 899]MBB4241458.1 hypothetical protein [Rhizobium tropici]MBB5592802.1 hypothetical protein [Rhizobium tropici]MBB6491844.1 hypothetical protein [Rhizobium tropici]